MLVDKKRLEEAFALLVAGRESFRSLETKLGVPKSTLHRWYVSWLDKHVKERERVLKEVEEKISLSTSGLNKLEKSYDEKNRILEEAYRKKRAALEEEVAKLKREAETIKGIFEKQGLLWNDGVAIVVGISSLRAEEGRLKTAVSRLTANISKLKEEAASWQEHLAKIKEEDDRLMRILMYKYDAIESFEREKSKLENELGSLRQHITQLQGSIKAFEGQKLRLEEEVARLQQAKAEGEASLKALENAKVKVAEEVNRLKGEAEGLRREIGEAGGRRAELLREVGRLERAERELLVKIDLLEDSLRQRSRDLQRLREQSTGALSQAHKSSESVESLLLKRIPTLTSLNKRQTRKTVNPSTNSN